MSLHLVTYLAHETLEFFYRDLPQTSGSVNSLAISKGFIKRKLTENVKKEHYLNLSTDSLIEQN